MNQIFENNILKKKQENNSPFLFKVALIGRPNVGKSTLFNRLVKKRMALVHATPGLTRDRRYGKAQFGDLVFEVIDTPGLFDPNTESYDNALAKLMKEQTVQAIKEAHVLFFLIDGKVGVLPHDLELAHLIRKYDKKTYLIFNKIENKTEESIAFSESGDLGIGEEVFLISAEHGIGHQDLIALIEDLDEKHREEHFISNFRESTSNLSEEKYSEQPLKLVILGRPNVGKSTLINRLIGEDRLLTMNKPGSTRDSITISWEYKGRTIDLIDTAGLRRNSKIGSNLETLFTMQSKKTLMYSECVVLVIDGSMPIEGQFGVGHFEKGFEKQDLFLSSLALKEGRPLVIALNKWDLNQNKSSEYQKKYLKELKSQIGLHFSKAGDIPIIPISALNQFGISTLMQRVLKQELLWNKKFSTSELNRWCIEATSKHPAPYAGGSRIRIKYMTQIKTRPPTFVLFANKEGELLDSYMRYLTNSFRTQFDLHGIPIRFRTKASPNPYAPLLKKRKSPQSTVKKKINNKTTRKVISKKPRSNKVKKT
jgi:GTP-binding protein